MVDVINTGKTLSRSDAFDDLDQPIWIRRPSSQVAAAFPAYVEDILIDSEQRLRPGGLDPCECRLSSDVPQ